jgi:hypothetical protein
MLHGNLIVDPGEAHAAARTGEAVAA